LAGGGLLFRTLIGLEGVDAGINPTNVLTFRISLPVSRYTPQRRTQFFARVLDEIRRLPGIQSASAISFLPFTGLDGATDVEIGGRPKPGPGEAPVVTVQTVMPGYFQTMGIPIRSGRDFKPDDNTIESPYRFIVSEKFAHRVLSGENPLGKQISVAMGNKNPFGEIIGVVGDVKEGSLDRDPEPTVYYIHAHLLYNGMNLVVRSAGNPLALTEPVRHII